MYRNERLVIRLNDREAEAVDKLAQAERLPASTLARRLLLMEAERSAQDSGAGQRRKTGARRGMQ